MRTIISIIIYICASFIGYYIAHGLDRLLTHINHYSENRKKERKYRILYEEYKKLNSEATSRETADLFISKRFNQLVNDYTEFLREND